MPTLASVKVEPTREERTPYLPALPGADRSIACKRRRKLPESNLLKM
jgi:hypothetical protein